MKKEDLLKAVGGADDRFIAEAAPKKINFKNRAPRYPMRLMTAAACLCIVAAVFFGYWLISPARLQKISLGTVGFSGRPTSDYIARIISRITLLGALLLSVVAIFPILFSQITTLILSKATSYADGMNISLGGTSIIILVGVALETVKQLESQMMMRHYKGFLD